MSKLDVATDFWPSTRPNFLHLQRFQDNFVPAIYLIESKSMQSDMKLLVTKAHYVKTTVNVVTQWSYIPKVEQIQLQK